MDIEEKRKRKSEIHRRWRAKNREHLREYRRKRHASDPERFAEESRKWLESHPGYAKQKYYENRDRILANQRERRAIYRAKHRQWARDAERKRRYGITREQYEKLLEVSRGKCACCGVKFNSKSKPHIDHCHKTGVIRGLLCQRCNHAEGLLGSVENAELLYKYMLRNELFYQGVN